MSSRTLPRLLAILLAFVLIAAACSGDDEPSSVETEDGGANLVSDDGAEPTAEPEPMDPCNLELVDTDVTESDIDNTNLTDKPIIEKPIPADPGTPQAFDIVVGDGQVAERGDVVIMQYAGSLYETGDEFDSSWARSGQPFPFELGQAQVIAGWDLGIEGMAVGGRRQLVLPANCAYGRRGSGSGSIGPNATLIFIVDLVQIEPVVDLPETVSGEVESIDLVEGDGVELADGDLGIAEWVAVFYETESKVGSSYASGEPLTFTVGQSTLGVDGFDEAITGMKVGGTRQLILPPAPVPEDGVATGPSETLVFQVELLSVIPGADPADKPEVELPDSEPTELVIEDLVVGEGDAAQNGDQVYVQYVGVEYPSGEEFDASWNRGQAFDFVLGTGGVIQGWDDGVLGMQVGGQRKLIIPADLAYGVLEEGQSLEEGNLQGKTLVFVVDLVAIG